MKTRRKFWKQGAIGSIVIYTIIFFAAIITLYPFWYVIINSLSDPLRVIRRDVVW
jgi:putative aldouronate transport system permease protein